LNGKKPKDKYDEIDTGMTLKDHNTGLTGLNVGSKNKLVNNIISKKALDNYNNNLRGEAIDGSKKKNTFQPKSNKNFLEENMKKIKEKEEEVRETEEEEKRRKDEEDKEKKRRLKLENVLDKDKAQTYTSKVEKLNPMDKVERLIMATRETTEKTKELMGMGKPKVKKSKEIEISNNELALNLVKGNKNNRSTTPVKTRERDTYKALDLERPRNRSNEPRQRQSRDKPRNRNYEEDDEEDEE